CRRGMEASRPTNATRLPFRESGAAADAAEAAAAAPSWHGSSVTSLNRWFWWSALTDIRRVPVPSGFCQSVSHIARRYRRRHSAGGGEDHQAGDSFIDVLEDLRVVLEEDIHVEA